MDLLSDEERLQAVLQRAYHTEHDMGDMQIRHRQELDAMHAEYEALKRERAEMQRENIRLKSMIKRMYEWLIGADLNNDMEDLYQSGGMTLEAHQEWLGVLAEFEFEATGKVWGYEMPTNEDVS